MARGIVTASGGNHGLATARAGAMAGVPTTIFLPTNAAPDKIEKLAAWGAEVRVIGSAWHEANVAALAFQAETGAAYFHPFADPDVVAGQGTVGLEILEQLPEVTTVLVAMGGGGLVSGVATAIKTLRPEVKIIGIEAAGAPVLLRGLEAGVNITLDEVTTSVATMACAHTEHAIFETVRELVDELRAGRRRGNARRGQMAVVRDGPCRRPQRGGGDRGAAAGPGAAGRGRACLRHRLRRRHGCGDGLGGSARQRAAALLHHAHEALEHVGALADAVMLELAGDPAGKVADAQRRFRATGRHRRRGRRNR